MVSYETSDRGYRRTCNLVIHFSGLKGHKDLKSSEKAWDLVIIAEILEKTVFHTNAKTDEYHMYYNFCIVDKPTYLKPVDIIEVRAFFRPSSSLECSSRAVKIAKSYKGFQLVHLQILRPSEPDFVSLEEKQAFILASSILLSAEIGHESSKPEIIMTYSETKSRVDTLDQKSSTDTTSRRTRRWFKEVWHAIMDIGGVTANVILSYSTPQEKT
ncbi:hypothetical protein QYM36_015412 [Artemia franciscana]|uniref:Uncharacterized protein n=1 Tax=Artemia franciscana TaxID=6661 RepID=A0AA88HER1_ARTSF|nr:hypothetical protein QYM36_015412 [Artemia franciscana]